MNRPPDVGAHAGHDLLLLAAAVDRDADATIRAAADLQVQACPECAATFAELQTASVALVAMPRSAPIPRDARITPEVAARIRGERGWRRALGWVRNPSLPNARPLATAFTTLGLAGLLLTAFLPGGIAAGLGGGGAAADRGVLSTVGAAIPPRTSTEGAGEQGTIKDSASPAPNLYTNNGAPGLNAGPTAADRLSEQGNGPTDTSGTPNPLSIPIGGISVVLLAIGLVLFAVRTVGRRST
jgi:hypothetical protein